MLKDDNIDHKMMPVSGYEEVMSEFRKEVAAEGGSPAVRCWLLLALSLPPRPAPPPTPHTYSLPFSFPPLTPCSCAASSW